MELLARYVTTPDGIRVLEIGCGPGVAAREISKRIGNGYILAIDRSAKAIQQAIIVSRTEIETGRLNGITYNPNINSP